ncbi:metallophosphoesterase [Trujillonella endophytica]|uniref:Calcineurin-like phosphoesterase n=1 Tax=Trujillonella endophytica TaxID=673521 RepID=A0A1H8PES3_9ACTN|nr:metallophosphoesterase [Trujillella endophytica]SEO40405.1 Calcineurin-like phosphoesterase [Trujillella endophytica]
MARRSDDAEQLLLPYPTTRRQRLEHLAHRAGGIARRVLRFVLRWLARILLPLLCAAALLQAFPYQATVQGVPFEVQGSLFTRPGLTADTTLGSWEFPDVSGVPFGVHVRPEDVDVLELTRLAGRDLPGFVEELRVDFAAEVPRIAWWLVAELVVGLAVGLAIAIALEMAVRHLRGRPRREHEVRQRLLQFGAAALVTLVVAAYGVLSYNENWVRESRLTGTLAAAQLFPGQLSSYYTEQSKAFDVLGSVVGIQAALQADIDDERTPDTAVRIMTISDMHLAATYPLVAQYAANYDVDLIVNAGDESAFGTSAEFTPEYRQAIADLAATTPMVWVAGNHDSPATVAIMRGIPGVTVLGTKTAVEDGFAVGAGVVEAFGLTIAGLPDPRVYGGPGAYGADAPDVVDPLQRAAVREALGMDDDEDGATDGGAADGENGGDGGAADGGAEGDPAGVDLFVLHEPAAADEVRELLPGQVRQTVSGHTHRQNASDELQDDDAAIELVEGTTGAGGLDNIVRGTERPPIAFSIESVSADCQFTRIVRFSIESAGPAADLGTDPATPQAYGDDVTVSTVYFRPQDVAEGRRCDTDLGVGAERPWADAG